MMNAAAEWVKTSAKLPTPGRSYLVITESAGQVPDVAFYNGVDAGGVRQWLLTDSSLGGVLFWAEILTPESEVLS